MSLALADALRQTGVDAVALRSWRDGNCRNSSDEEILVLAGLDGRVFVTYDCKTIPLLLTELAETGRHHAGVILVDENTVRSSDIGTLCRALQKADRESGDDNWVDRVVFLRVR
ncbi:MAG: DUF5615 family PIN-like protein [Dehalococcoidia bacterium]|nr:DUF5615 family PIN-like protein [Dehalococcoidia bacterium]